MEVLEAQDIPPKMSSILNQQSFQKMVCAERMSIAKKNLLAEDLPAWTVPMVMCGNHFLDNKDEGGCISRRVVVFEFKHFIAKPDAGLLRRIIARELPNVACRFLTAYFALVAKHTDDVFWTFCPEYLKRTREVVRHETSYIARFLGSNIDEYSERASYAIGLKFEAGAVCLQTRFREAFKEYMHDNFVDVKVKVTAADDSALLHAGYVLHDDHSVCKSCSQPLFVGCCDAYSSNNHSRRKVIINMKIIRVLREDM